MSVIKGGISMQKSKFSVLAIDSLSEDSGSEEEHDWTQVKSTGTDKSKGKTKQGGGGSTDGERPLSKNAKKRARKKKNRSVLTDDSHNEGGTPSQSNLSWEQESRMRNQVAADVDFHKDLERAILLSKSDAEHHAAILEESRIAERLAISESISMSLSGPPPKASGKKGVTLSLQEFHRADNASDQKSSKSKVSDMLLDDPFPITPTSPDENFFDRLSESIAKEVSREESKQQSTRSRQETSSEDLPRLAQLKDDLEKRDALIEKLRKHNELLKKALKEAKERNRSLCKILSQGEFSTKTELIEQVEQLTTVKNELTEEVKSLHTSLEQEKSKNKGLKIEVAKLGGGTAKSSRIKTD